MTTALQGNELATCSRFKAKPRKKYKFLKEPLVNAEVFSKIIWRLFSLLIAEEKHGGWNSFSFDAQCGYYPEHQRNNEWCCPYFPLAVSKRAIVSLMSVWKRSCNFALASFPERKWREGKEREKEAAAERGWERRGGKQRFTADGLLMPGHWAWISVGNNYVQKFSKNCQCWIAVGSSFQTQIILWYLLLQPCLGCSWVPLPFAVLRLGLTQTLKPP